MPNYYYIKSGFGTNTSTTTYTSRHTGLFSSLSASLVYDSILALTTAGIIWGDGDEVISADDHHKIYTGVIGLRIANSLDNPSNVLVISVDVNDITKYKKGATEETDGYLTISPTNLRDGNIGVYGMTFISTTSYIDIGPKHTRVNYTDCTLTATYLSLGGSQGGLTALFTKCTLNVGYFRSSLGKSVFKDCVVNITGTYIANAQGSISFISCDFSGGPPNLLLNEVSGTYTSPIINFINCIYPVGWGNGVGGLYKYTYEINGYGMDGDTLSWSNFESSLQTDDIIYLTENLSISINSGADAVGINDVIKKEVLQFYGQDLSASKTYTFNIITNNGITLTNADFWIELQYQNNTNIAKSDTVSSREPDFMSSGSAYAINAEAWVESLTTPIKQSVPISIPALSNITDGYVKVFLNLAKPNVDVWVDLTPEIT